MCGVGRELGVIHRKCTHGERIGMGLIQHLYMKFSKHNNKVNIFKKWFGIKAPITSTSNSIERVFINRKEKGWKRKRGESAGLASYASNLRS